MLRKVFGLFVFSSLLWFGIAFAEEVAVNESAADGAVIDDMKPAPFMIFNKVCPVCGMNIPEDALGKTTVEYKNKVYNVCSSGDKDAFLVDPEKYSKIAEDEMAKSSEVVQSAPAEELAVPAK